MTCSQCQLKLKGMLLIFGMLCGTSWAEEPSLGGGKLPTVPIPLQSSVSSLADLKRLNQLELEQLYSNAEPGPYPVGFLRGQVLLVTGTSLPRLKTRLTGIVWKGKHINEEGDFINQWTGFRAVHSNAYQGPSLFDGRPSMILEYPEKTPYFGKMRDEAREVAPGLYLAMVFERNPPCKFRGFIGLELEPGKVRGYR